MLYSGAYRNSPSAGLALRWAPETRFFKLILNFSSVRKWNKRRSVRLVCRHPRTCENHRSDLTPDRVFTEKRFAMLCLFCLVLAHLQKWQSVLIVICTIMAMCLVIMTVTVLDLSHITPKKTLRTFCRLQVMVIALAMITMILIIHHPELIAGP